jgi:PAS domain S-box-containing protein
VLAALAIGLILSFIQIASDFARENARIDSLVEQVAGVTEGSASAAAFTLDSGLAGQVVNGLMAYRAIREVTLSAEFDRVLAQSHRAQETGALPWLTATLFGPDRTYEVPLHDPRGDDIGKLVIQVDAAVVGLDFLNRSAVIVAGGLLRNLLLAAVLTLLFYHLLTKPFLQMAGRIRTLDPYRPGAQALTAPPGHEDDELGLLVRATERLRSSFAGVLREKEQDIAERIRAEEALKESEQRFRATFDQAAVGIAHVGPDGRWLRVNQRLCDIVGYGREEFLKLTFQDITHPDDLDADIESLGPVLAGELPIYSREKRYIRKDGSIVWIALTVALVRHASGEPNYFISVIEDISARKRAEESLRQLNDELEERVEQRTAELRTAQDELVRKERLAALGQLTATVSHELRNPLGAMRTSVAAIKKLTDDAEPILQTSLQIVDRSITRCDNIVGDLLDYSRTRGLETELTALDDWLAGLLDEYEPSQGVTLRQELASGASVALDRERFRRLLLNLLDNACQAMGGDDARRDGEQVVTVASRLAEGQAEIVVSDTGPGIAPEVKDEVFEPLYSTKSFGVGLGLTIVKRIVEQHDGRIEIQSEPDRGAQFVLRLPAQVS